MEIREIQKEEIHKIKKLRDYAFRTSSGGGEEDFFLLDGTWKAFWSI
ncbi:hypothetical protein [Listeria floridensis]|nr:hypothetical protein [Listeria floridensis]